MTPPDKKAAPEKPAALDPDNVALSAERLKEIRAKAAKIVAEERLKALEKMELDKALEEIRGKEGLRTGDPIEDEIVNLTIDLGVSAPDIKINGRAFVHGQTYPVPRHQARTLMEIMYRTALHEHHLTDKPLSEFYRKPRHTLLTRRGAENAPRRPDEGSPAGAA